MDWPPRSDVRRFFGEARRGVPCSRGWVSPSASRALVTLKLSRESTNDAAAAASEAVSRSPELSALPFEPPAIRAGAHHIERSVSHPLPRRWPRYRQMAIDGESMGRRHYRLELTTSFALHHNRPGCRKLYLRLLLAGEATTVADACAAQAALIDARSQGNRGSR